MLTQVDWTFVAGSAMLSISIAFNAISVHATCTAVFVAVAAVLGFGFGSVRTLGRITWLAWVGVASILVASRSFDFLFFNSKSLFLMTNSSHRHHCRWHRGSPSSRASGRPLVFRLRAIQTSNFPRSCLGLVVLNLCFCWYTGFLPHCV